MICVVCGRLVVEHADWCAWMVRCMAERSAGLPATEDWPVWMDVYATDGRPVGVRV